jgi:23S rRNA (uracil1939-C5)-methyltransferase
MEIELEKWSHGGEALAFIKGKPLFVPGGVPGDVVKVRIISEKKQYGRALIESVMTAGPERITPPCPVYAECGGCQWQHTTYGEQLRAKRQLLIETLHKVGGWESELLAERVSPVWGMETPWTYRNKAQFPVQNIAGQLRLGFYQHRSHQVIPLEHCMIQHELMNDLLAYLQDALQALQAQGLTAYNEASHTGILRHVVLRHGFKTGQTLVGFVTTTPVQHLLQPLAQELMERFPTVKGVVSNLNPDRTNRILGQVTESLAGQTFYTDQLGAFQFDVSLPAFFQVNPLQTEKLYDCAAQFLTPSQGQYASLLDAYSGAGTLSLWLSNIAKSVVGVESNRAAIDNAISNAQRNGVNNVRFVHDKVENVISDCITGVDAMLVDPPRKGCEEKVLKAFIASDIPQLVYISCNPATLARDSALLRRGGFDLMQCQPVDMFPQTHHLETVARFQRIVLN